MTDNNISECTDKNSQQTQQEQPKMSGPSFMNINLEQNQQNKQNQHLQ